MEKRKKGKTEGMPVGAERIRIYALIAAAFVVIAAASVLLAPQRAGALQRCRNIIMQQNKDSCLSYLASQTRNVSVCGYMSRQSADYCYADVAKLTSNASACTMISNQSETYGCVFGIANSTGSYSTCSYLKGEQREYCIEEVATELGNVTACSSLNSSGAQVCTSAIYLGMAKSGENATYCAQVSNNTDQGSVASILALSGAYAGSSANMTLESALNPVEYLQGNGYGFSARDLCYITVASSARNPAACAMISNTTLEGICNQSTYGPARPNLNQSSALPSTLCSQYAGQNYSSCNDIMAITEAVSTGNASFCASINYSQHRYLCYAAMARDYNSTSYCGYISNSSANQECIQNINYNMTQ